MVSIRRALVGLIEAVGRFRDALSQWLPNTSVSTPWLQGLPSPQAIAEANFKLAQTVLDAQRRYALRILDSLSPADEAEEAPAAPKPAVVAPAQNA